MRWETMLILKPIEDNVKAEIAELKAYMETQEITNIKIENWGIKNLAFPLGEYQKGFYSLFRFECSNRDTINMIDKYLKQREMVLRHMIVREVKPY